MTVEETRVEMRKHREWSPEWIALRATLPPHTFLPSAEDRGRDAKYDEPQSESGPYIPGTVQPKDRPPRAVV